MSTLSSAGAGSSGAVVVRAASDGDGAAIARLIAGVFAEYPGCVYEPSEFPELAAPASHFAGLGGRLWVAEDGDRLIGTFGLAATAEPGVFTLHKVYLDAAARGLGLARRMLDEAIAFARAAGATELRLWTDTRFTAGHRFYDRYGFTRIPVRRFLADASDSWEFAYRLPLPASGEARP
ncbi:putative acetyltransferase [Pseudoxanthobacter soli DSM 19599]|uniref:Putative acetyltransferase n=1 Tax=Pseudoxanthobacter soli DSM 19599 TaxID=1123029 RepID=A0A1M7ZD68_9HYPH|nr:GNAT family N-acetyltransferase [Pseudoxanthobacter soli]SHO62827.1 putative acetyltransferase [Pseudoxanthobacter soli DSM 19599]